MDACERFAQGGGSSDGETEKTKGGDDDNDETGSRRGSSRGKSKCQEEGNCW